MFDMADIDALLASLGALMEQGQIPEEATRRWRRSGSRVEGV